MLNAQLVSNIIHLMQAVFGLLAIHGITYRLIAIDTRMAIANGNDFFHLMNQLKQGKPFQKLDRSGCGWLNRLRGDTENYEMSSQIEGMYIQSQAYLSVITMVAAIETLFGLLGTVGGFVVSESVDSMSLSIAFRTTFWGILASVPPTVYLYCSEPFRNRLHFQMQSLLEVTTQVNELSAQENLPPVTTTIAIAPSQTSPPLSKATTASKSTMVANIQSKGHKQDCDDGPTTMKLPKHVDRETPVTAKYKMSNQGFTSDETSNASNPVTDGERAYALISAVHESETASNFKPLTAQTTSKPNEELTVFVGHA